ncbi:23S rRNA (adenine(2030)-N(6))-methyltransferase RlmJ [Roseospira visakhapatnamensis]|uniref:Ribosomal RNA large subunit methyltransferase J n=1 Tax=Roseospira visakhapatnamensis TaxID=390880 RepID=A0A7W6RCU0_9PROT|nr:23S rRNA (adenine(2030)-N(6))-methyltransferase RlmJ [Roseospira visakhapatnamensis]MBB4266078.1 23S rRNA (adenine2030-N6)-methyltransferase [Roseospira visakhapatnamensis]
MNYRHGYHAGNAGDVLKHAVMMLVLEHLRAKAKPFVVVDTHAGAGAYRLDGAEAGRTGEWRDGIGRLLDDPDPPAALRPYLDRVRAWRPDGGGVDGLWYPGSPLLARAALRAGDRLVAIEAHAETQATLARVLGRARGVVCRCGDGYRVLAGLLPPPERRGLVLIDPPFEARTEFSDMAEALRGAHRRFPTGQYMLWYPIKDPGLVESFHQTLVDTGIPRMVCVEMTVKPVTTVTGLAGAGLILVNPPWRLDATLGDVLPWLARRLARARGGYWRLDWLRGEDDGARI